MNSEATETAALRSRVADLEQQLALSDAGVSRLAERCLALEQEVQAYLAAQPRQALHENAALLLPKLFFDTGFGYSEQESLAAPEGAYDELTQLVTAEFELPVEARALRLDPGELPCCIVGLTLSDDRLLFRPANGLLLKEDEALFLRPDPNLALEGLSRYPAGLRLVISYHYYPLEKLAHEPLFQAMLDGIGQLRHQELEAQERIDALQQQLAETRASQQEYETALEGVLASSSWKLTAPFRRLAGLLHPGR